MRFWTLVEIGTHDNSCEQRESYCERASRVIVHVFIQGRLPMAFAMLRSSQRVRLAGAAGAAVCGAAASYFAPPAALEQLWTPTNWFAVAADPPPALSPWEWRPLKVWSVTPQSHNVSLIRFVFDDVHAAAGMECASYLLTRAYIGKEKPDGTRGAVLRPYTPSHTTIGYLELVIKRYEEGKMSQHIHSLKPGDTLDFKGPIMGTYIIPNEFESIGLIAGGTGITPMLQVHAPRHVHTCSRCTHRGICIHAPGACMHACAFVHMYVLQVHACMRAHSCTCTCSRWRSACSRMTSTRRECR